MRESLGTALPWFPDEVGNRSVLIGFSGGVDSTVLLHLLGAPGGLFDDAGGPRLVAAHLDHMLRPDSGDQAHFASTVATSLGIETCSARRDVAALARREGRSVEEAGRLARLDFLAELAKEKRTSTVLLGHTLTDQAETVLLQLTRGAGTRGLGAMAPARNDTRGLVIVRPLLSVSRTETTELANEEGWPFYSDPSNKRGDFTRNRIRHEALPLLRESVNPQAESALARTASLLRDDEEWLCEITSGRFREMATIAGVGESASVRFGVADLAAAHPALARRLVREGLRVARGDLRRIGAVHIEAVLRLIKARRGGSSLDLPGAVVRLEHQTLTISRAGRAASGRATST